MRSLPRPAVDPARAATGSQPATIGRYFTRPGRHPFDGVDWQRREAPLPGAPGEAPSHRLVEVPGCWSQSAAAALAGELGPTRPGSPQPEWSARELVGRVVTTLTARGEEGRVLPDDASAGAFADELSHLILHQMLTFAAPVWRTLGREPEPLCCACPITSLGEPVASALDLAAGGGQVLPHGCAAGVNLSALRSAGEAGGVGPLQFLDGVEALAAVIRAPERRHPPAAMAVLNVDHPDIRRFVAGPAPGRGAASRGGGALRAVRLPDAFMAAAAAGGWWETRAVATGEVVAREPARELLQLLVDRALTDGQPMLQFDDAINRWNTCPASGRVSASSPCGEYVFLDDTACQLAVLDLARFADDAGRLDPEAFRQAVGIAVVALEILVSSSRYPNARIAARTRELRPLGLACANLASLVAASGHGYDSDAGRALAAAVTSLLTGEAYLQSARLAAAVGSFAAYPANRAPMLEVLERHREAAHHLAARPVPGELLRAAISVWDEALTLGTRSGFRHAQVTTVAPTAAAARLMDCATAGVEPLPDDDRVSALAVLRMAGAVQPFLSGAATATLLVPPQSSQEEALELVLQAWALGLKDISLRGKHLASADDLACDAAAPPPRRRPLPEPRRVVTQRLGADGHDGQVTVALFEDGSPGELRVALASGNPALADLMEAISTSVSATLQHGVPLANVLDDLSRLHFDPAAWPATPAGERASAAIAQVSSWLGARFLANNRGAPAVGTAATSRETPAASPSASFVG